MNNNKEIDIEIQLSELKVWADRSLFYLAKIFTDQIKPGESYRYLRLPKLPEEFQEDSSDIELWAKFIPTSNAPRALRKIAMFTEYLTVLYASGTC